MHVAPFLFTSRMIANWLRNDGDTCSLLWAARWAERREAWAAISMGLGPRTGLRSYGDKGAAKSAEDHDYWHEELAPAS